MDPTAWFFNTIRDSWNYATAHPFLVLVFVLGFMLFASLVSSAAPINEDNDNARND